MRTVCLAIVIILTTVVFSHAHGKSAHKQESFPAIAETSFSSETASSSAGIPGTKDFWDDYGVLALGILTALNFAATLSAALSRKRFPNWFFYHRLFAYITLGLMIFHASFAVWTHFFDKL